MGTRATTDRLHRTYGVALVLLGLGTFALSHVFERGFVHGLFQGMTVALMVFAAYLIGRTFRRASASEEDQLWRPSEDQK